MVTNERPAAIPPHDLAIQPHFRPPTTTHAQECLGVGAVILSWNEAMNEHGPAMLYRRWLPGDPPACDCPQHPSGTRRRDGQPPRQHHRWNCPLTPIWAQTMRDLDCNPWTVIENSLMPATADFHAAHSRIRQRPFVWDGEKGTHCGRGPCCLGDGHDGRCRM